MSTTARLILDSMHRAGEAVTAAEIAEDTEFAVSTVRQNLKVLVAKGAVDRVGEAISGAATYRLAAEARS